VTGTSTACLTIGTRKSALARWQTDWVRKRLEEAWSDLRLEVEQFTTTGDRILDRPLPEIGGKGLFTAELEEALHTGVIDLAVHSLKDLPIEEVPGLVLGAICERADARDVLISARGYTLATLPEGARVGTSSLRRAAQLLAARPDLRLAPLRGNVDTRIRKAHDREYDAIVLALAGVQRLGLDEHITERLPFDAMLPAPGQGAMAVQCRAGDAATLQLLNVLEHAATRACVTAERTFLQSLGGGCSSPVAAYAYRDDSGTLQMSALAGAPDGTRVVRVTGSGADPRELGTRLAGQALSAGAREVMQ
jgi:hydroxymethylbilane synthase